MNEFAVIHTFFKYLTSAREDVVVSIGDDAAVLTPAFGNQLLVSTDTLVAEVHFLSAWDPYDIAYKAVIVNLSDMAAMGAQPCWLTLALTLPRCEESWLQRFAAGLHAALTPWDVTLVGGDTTRGPLSMTLTIMGQVPQGMAILRSGARPGDTIYVTGDLGAAACAIEYLTKPEGIAPQDRAILMEKLLHPKARLEIGLSLRNVASAAVDISDGLTADLAHICEASGVGALLNLAAIPVHPVVTKCQGAKALDLALGGGDDYELCFTIPSHRKASFLQQMHEQNHRCYDIGVIEQQVGLRLCDQTQSIIPLRPRGYTHFCCTK